MHWDVSPMRGIRDGAQGGRGSAVWHHGTCPRGTRPIPEVITDTSPGTEPVTEARTDDIPDNADIADSSEHANRADRANRVDQADRADQADGILTGRPARPDITSRADIATLVTDFYGRAFADPLLGRIFVDVARLDLPAHLPVMCDFWEVVIFRAGRYQRNAFRAHVDLNAKTPLRPDHFARWLELWTATVDDLYSGEHADRAKVQAGRIAASMSGRLSGEAGEPSGEADEAGDGFDAPVDRVHAIGRRPPDPDS